MTDSARTAGTNPGGNADVHAGINVGIKDVAREAGVSVGTVSNVINQPDRVSPATLEHVRRVIARLGYVRSESARQLRADSLRT